LSPLALRVNLLALRAVPLDDGVTVTDGTIGRSAAGGAVHARRMPLPPHLGGLSSCLVALSPLESRNIMELFLVAETLRRYKTKKFP
jgi:hypothetical protein